MADSSTCSSEESSDEDEHGEASASLPDPVGSTAAARHPNRKKLRYFRDYLQRLPKHQRRRIQKEIEKSPKPGETHVKLTIENCGRINFNEANIFNRGTLIMNKIYVQIKLNYMGSVQGPLT